MLEVERWEQAVTHSYSFQEEYVVDILNISGMRSGTLKYLKTAQSYS